MGNRQYRRFGHKEIVLVFFRARLPSQSPILGCQRAKIRQSDRYILMSLKVAIIAFVTVWCTKTVRLECHTSSPVTLKEYFAKVTFAAFSDASATTLLALFPRYPH